MIQESTQHEVQIKCMYIYDTLFHKRGELYLYYPFKFSVNHLANKNIEESAPDKYDFLTIFINWSIIVIACSNEWTAS